MSSDGRQKGGGRNLDLGFISGARGVTNPLPGSSAPTLKYRHFRHYLTHAVRCESHTRTPSEGVHQTGSATTGKKGGELFPFRGVEINFAQWGPALTAVGFKGRSNF